MLLTGNGLTVSEDLARRFIVVEFDARTEDPEARKFKIDIRADVMARRDELLVAALTIWRWGRITTGIQPGRALGSFEQWCRWVLDPLLALGCQDPAERVSEVKARDGRRQDIAELFGVWYKKHQSRPLKASDLDEEVKRVADPQGRGRQYLTSYVENLVGTRMAGFVLTSQAPVGKWGAATYSLQQASEPSQSRRDHRGHRADPQARSGVGYGRRTEGTSDPIPPVTPMPSTTADTNPSDPLEPESECEGVL